MDKVVSMYEAKTNFSKLVKQAKAGKVIYVGAYGHAEAIIAPLPDRKKVKIGVWEHKAKPLDFAALDALDAEIAAEFEASSKKPLDF